MNLPKFKNFLVNKVVNSLFPNIHGEADINLFMSDSSFIPVPVPSHKVRENIQEHFIKNKQAYELDQLINTKNSVVTEQMVLDVDFALQLKLNTVSFDQNGISFSILKHISESFKTDQIYISGDGHDYEYSEYTSEHHSEIILSIVPGDKKQLLANYHVWYQTWHDNKVSKNQSGNLKI